MKILNLKPEPIEVFDFLNAGRRPNQFYVDQLPVYLAEVDRLPDVLDAIVVTADLQGREEFPDRQQSDQLRLLGEVLPEMLRPTLAGLGFSPGANVSAILAGDFYTYPDLRGRGGNGDVTEVWHAFADEYVWVTGVAGNHDTFGESKRMSGARSHVKFLDEDRVELSGLKIAGLSGVIGNPKKNFRRTQDEFLAAVEKLLSSETDILVMHDGPNAPGGCKGIQEVREIVEFTRPRLVVRGHSHWPTPFVELANGVQVLNVDATVVILKAGLSEATSDFNQGHDDG